MFRVIVPPHLWIVSNFLMFFSCCDCCMTYFDELHFEWTANLRCNFCDGMTVAGGDPLGYFDFNMIQQLLLNGLESAALFGVTAAAMEYAYDRNWVSKFPN